ncbi:cobalamin-independent synthase, partial [Blyttiomyces helicus]
MVTATNLGFPRMGGNRELKKTVENFWAGKIDEKALLAGAKNIRREHWELQRDAGIAAGHIPSNDFSFYDHVLDHVHLFGAVPKRYAGLTNHIDAYFATGRGLQKKEEGIDVPAMEMKKWFDTNYHYIVPEFSINQEFSLATTKPIDQFLEAKELGIQTRPVLLGPISFLVLGKAARGDAFETISLLPKLIPVYEQLLVKLAEAGAEWVQIDEPVLQLDLAESFKAHYTTAYTALAAAAPKLQILLATYFGRLGDNLKIVADLPIAGLHVDAVRAPEELDAVIQAIAPRNIVLSVGVINGRNIWKADLEKVIATINHVVGHIDSSKVFVAPSCSLLHSPHSLAAEVKMDAAIKDWLSFAVEKLHEVVVVAKGVNHGDDAIKAELDANRASVKARRESPLIHDEKVKAEMKAITEDMFARRSPFPVRAAAQQAKLHLPSFPTTTVGSFPQTKEVRVARQKLKKGEWTVAQYDEFIKAETDRCIKIQEELGLDVLVHGEFERNDMVEYFGESLKGYVFSQNGWVQSYGSRCVKPPIIYGDVSRPTPMTVDWSVYAQSRTKLPMKGMLTGPVTMLQWSFVRDDQPRSETAFQLALAIRKEVQDLEAAKIPVIQIDEPAIREGLPLRR